MSHERATGVEAKLRVARERATVEKKRDAAEKAVPGAFIDGYKELKGKVSAAFHAYEFYGFIL